MVNVDLRDKHLSENVKAITELRKTGMFSEEELQRLYDEQVKKDEEEERRELCRRNYAAQMESLGYDADGNPK